MGESCIVSHFSPSEMVCRGRTDQRLCAMKSSFPMLECAVINADLDGTPAAFPADMELYLKLGLSLQFLLLSKLHSLCHHYERLKL